MMKKTIKISIFLFFLLLQNIVFADRYIKIASIDFGYIFKNYSATRKIRYRLKLIRKRVIAQVNRQRKYIRKLMKNFKRNAQNFSDMERRWRYSEIELRKSQLLAKIYYYKSRLRRIENKMILPFKTEIYLAAKKLAQKKGFSIVMSKKGFIMVEAKYDLTKFVLVYLERKLRGERRE